MKMEQGRETARKKMKNFLVVEKRREKYLAECFN
jgi:hypothetical protein